MKTKYNFTLILAFIVINLWAQPPLPGDGDGDVTDTPIHFLIPIALILGAFLGYNKINNQK